MYFSKRLRSRRSVPADTSVRLLSHSRVSASTELAKANFEVFRTVQSRWIRIGVIGSAVLGLGRALGETMAVTFIIGNSHDFPKGLFDAGSTIASTIANEFNEASGMQQSALIALGLVLFLITFTVLALARLLLRNQARV